MGARLAMRTGGRSAGPEHLGHVEGTPPETDLGMTKAPSRRIPVAEGLSCAERVTRIELA
ncbi:hypothetical protein EV648_109283 [Kribbella sp. VKM Ac-2568]|nr:hypothetical protein EV648_109283 [Kribbella sp. VKM Ac-2568]